MSHELSSYTRNWELTPYEMQRTCQELISGDCETGVSAKCVQSELTCPICLDILKQTMTTKECLHRFCNLCITTALRSGNKECPTCRKKLISKRSLRPDPNFDALIEKLFPNRKEFDTFQEKVLKKMSKSKHGASVAKDNNTQIDALTDSYAATDSELAPDQSEISMHETDQTANNEVVSSAVEPSVQENIDDSINLSRDYVAQDASANISSAPQEEKPMNLPGAKVVKTSPELNSSHAKKLKRKSLKESSSTRQSVRKRRKDKDVVIALESSKTVEIDNDDNECDFELVCQAHPDEKNYDFVRFIKTFCRTYVKHLSAYLRLRCEMLEFDGAYNVGRLNRCFSEQSDHFQLFICVNNEYVLLDSDMSLMEIVNRYSLQGSLPLNLYYKRNA